MQEEIMENFIRKMGEIGVTREQLVVLLQIYLGEGQ